MSSFPTRRKFLQLSAAGAACGALAIAGDGTLFEANRPQLVSIEIPLPRLADSFDGFRIAQLSDLHYDDTFSVVPLRKAIDIVNGLQAGSGRGDRRLCYLSRPGPPTGAIRAAKSR